MTTTGGSLHWRFRHFDLFEAGEWHAVLQLRAKVFIVEQNCPYLDPDHKDPKSWHVEGFLDGMLVATLRVVPPDVSYDEPSIGRLVVDPNLRGQQLGRELMRRGMAFCRDLYPKPIRISGQAYLQNFYESLGFETVSEPYLEDDIPHIEMLLPAP